MNCLPPAAITRRAAHTLQRGLKPSSRASSSSTVLTPPPSSRRAPRKTLRSLVELHHKSSSFLPNTSSETIHQGFSRAFRWSEPLWQEYNAPDFGISTTQNSFLPEVAARHAHRGIGGIEAFRVYKTSGDSAGASVGPGEPSPKPVRPLRSAWTSEQSWSYNSYSGGSSRDPADLSEREARVWEALSGTYVRGARKQVDMGLEGVEEYAEAKGEPVSSLAQKWVHRHSY